MEPWKEKAVSLIIHWDKCKVKTASGRKRGLLVNSALCELNWLEESVLYLHTIPYTHTHIYIYSQTNKLVHTCAEKFITELSLWPSKGQEYMFISVPWSAAPSQREWAVKALFIHPTSWSFSTTRLGSSWTVKAGLGNLNSKHLGNYGLRQNCNP